MMNLFLRLRYLLLKKYIKKVTFDDRRLIFSDDFRTLTNFRVKDKEFYNENDTWFSKQMVRIVPEGVELLCVKDRAEHESWQGKRTTNYTAGMIDTYETLGGIMKYYGLRNVWEIEAKLPESWAAIWLMRYEHNEPGYERHQITPEIDIAEVNSGVIGSSIHYGYSDVKYTKSSVTNNIVKPDGKFHKYAVEMLPHGYNFYIDGVLVSSFMNEDPEFVSGVPCYLILNNASNKDCAEDSYSMIIKSVKVYV